MDEAARTALPRALARALRGRPDQARGSTRTSAPASPPPASSTTCRCSSTRPRRSSTTSARTATLALHGDVDAALQRFWTDTRERYRFLQHDPRAAAAAAGGAVPQARGILRPLPTPHAHAARCAARDAGRGLGRAPLPDLSVDRGAPEPLAALQQPPRGDAAPRAARRRERGPARDPARAAARQPASSRRASPRWPTSRPATSTSRSPSRRWPKGFAWHRAAPTAAPIEFVTETELFADRAGARRRRRSRSRPATSRR